MQARWSSCRPASDPDGTIDGYAWEQMGGTTIILAGADTATAMFIASDVSADETLTFRITVTDDDGATNSDDVWVTVTAGIAPADEDTCVDELEQAVAFTSLDGTYNTGVPTLWDGTPFIVDVSSTFPNAHELLNVVEEEATIIHAALGYEIVVAGDVLPLANLTDTQLTNALSGSQLIPPDQHIEIRCCDDNAGTAFPWWRMILLTVDGEMQARHNIVHELYHVLGFVHSDETEGVTMSYPLDLALEFPPDEEGNIIGDWYFYTLSTPDDLAKLACIYD